MLPGSFRKRDGYTLIELMVIIVLIGIAMAVVVPNFAGGLNATKSERAAAELQSDLRWAISNARAEGRPLQVVFSESGYIVRDAADSTRIYKSRDYGTAASFASSGDPLVFPWGMVQPAQVSVDGATGLRQLNLLPTGKLRYHTEEVTP